MSKRAVRSFTAASPRVSSSRIARRLGSASAWKILFSATAALDMLDTLADAYGSSTGIRTAVATRPAHGSEGSYARGPIPERGHFHAPRACNRCDIAGVPRQLQVPGDKLLGR